MQQQRQIHNCLRIVNNKQTYLYGLTFSILNSNYLLKHKLNYIIIPSQPYLYGIYCHAGVEELLGGLAGGPGKEKELGRDRLGQGVLAKLARFAKLLVCDFEKLEKYYGRDLVTFLIKSNSITPIKQHQLQQKNLTTALVNLITQHNLLQLAQPQTLQKPPSKQPYISPQPTNKNNNTSTNSHAQLINWINCPEYELKIVVPEAGMTTYLVYRNWIIAVDPTEEFLVYLGNRYVSDLGDHPDRSISRTDNRLISLLHAVIVTKSNSVMSVLNLLISDGVDKVRILVTSPQFHQQILNQSQKQLHYPPELLSNRLLIRQIPNPKTKYPLLPTSSPYTLQSPNHLTCSYKQLSQQSQSMLEICFGGQADLKGNRRVLFYTPAAMGFEDFGEVEVRHFPKEIVEDNVDFVVLWKLDEGLGKELKALPQQLRKKIIYNRLQHKYNHKYFTTFQKHKFQSCTVTNYQYINLLTTKLAISKNSSSTILSSVQHKQIKYLNTNTNVNTNMGFSINQAQNVMGFGLTSLRHKSRPGCQVYEMGNQAEMDTFGQVIRVLEGFVQVWGYRDTNKQEQTIKELQTWVVGAHDFTDPTYTLTNTIKLLSLKHSKIQLQRLSDHSPQIPTSITPKSSQPTQSHLSTIPSNTLLQSLTPHQQAQLNQICHPITFQVGFKTNNKNSCVYFISKGAMKWSDSEVVANSGDFVGDLESYYGGVDIDGYVEVVKDTWALQINIWEFDRYFLRHNPHILHTIFSKGRIFN